MLHRTFTILIVLLSTISALAAPFQVSTAELRLIGQRMSYFQDKGGVFNRQDVLDKLNLFQPCNEDVFVNKPSTGKYWFYFSMSNNSGEDLWIDISNATLTEIDLFVFDEEFNLNDSIVGGSLRPDSLRTIDCYTFIHPLLQKSDTNIHHFLVAISTNINFEIPVYIGSVDTILNNRKSHENFSVFAIGAFVVFFLYNLFIYFNMRSKVYLYYSAYLVAAIVVGAYLNNYPIIEYVLGKNIAYNYLDTWIWLLFYFAGIFTITYFELQRIDRTFYLAVRIMTVVFIIFGVLNLFVPLPYLANVFQLVAALFFLICLVGGYRLLIRGEPRARLYCLGWSFLIVGIACYLLVYNGLLPYNPLTRNLSYVGYLFEALIFSHALGQRLTDLQEESKVLTLSLIKKNNELVEINESLDAFNYHVSHDLKTVLNNTIAMSRMTRKYNEKGDTQKVEEIVQKLEEVAHNGTETVQGFLSIGSIDTIINEDFNATIEIIEELSRIQSNHDLENQIDLKLDDIAVKQIKMHPKAFESIFLNLFTNTIKYSSDNPRANLRVFIDEQRLKMHYQDFGKGINMEKYGRRIFQPFFRGENATNVEGSGIGLFILKRIVTNYGGHIQLDSKPGEGIFLELDFPLNLIVE